jgi:hypothetical protein
MQGDREIQVERELQQAWQSAGGKTSRESFLVACSVPLSGPKGGATGRECPLGQASGTPRAQPT